MKKKILYSILSMLLLTVVFGINSSMAATLTKSEAQELLDRIPDEIVINIKESEFELADQEVSQQIKSIIGEETVYLNKIYKYRGGAYDADKIDIRKSQIIISSSEGAVEKDIKVTYSNTTQYNETDKTFVEDKIEGINFDRKWEYEIYDSGREQQYDKKTDFSWNKLIGTDEVTIVEDYAFEDGTDFSHIKKYILYIFKNDILYKVVEASKEDMGRIKIPSHLVETDEIYINYAKPILEKVANSTEEWDDGNGTVYTETSEVKDVERIYDDFIAFRVTCIYRSYTNENLVSEDEYYQTVLIAKENEYRCQIVPVLKDAEILRKLNVEYIRGDIEITKKDFGFNNSLNDSYTPKILLIDNNGNICETTVSKSQDDIYYFETELNNLQIDEQYFVQAVCTDPNNLNTTKNINATIEKNKKINTSNNDITIKSSLENNYVKLNVTEKEEQLGDLGDINGDGEINARDAKLAIQHFTGKLTLTPEQIARADVFSDGEVNARDAKLIIQFFTGKISSFV